MKHADIIKQMTLEEKCYLFSGKDFWQTRSVERLGVPNMTLSDGPHGIRKQAGEGDQLGLNPSLPATCFQQSQEPEQKPYLSYSFEDSLPAFPHRLH